VERLKQEGETGRAKISILALHDRWSCIIQGWFLARMFEHPEQLFSAFRGVLVPIRNGFEILTVITITSGRFC